MYTPVPALCNVQAQGIAWDLGIPGPQPAKAWNTAPGNQSSALHLNITAQGFSGIPLSAIFKAFLCGHALEAVDELL